MKKLVALLGIVTLLGGCEKIAKSGDTVVIDFIGFLGEKEFMGGTAFGYPLKLGSGTFIPGFEDQLIGAKVGEKRDVNVTFPVDYPHKNLAGKDVVFKVTVNEIKR